MINDLNKAVTNSFGYIVTLFEGALKNAEYVVEDTAEGLEFVKLVMHEGKMRVVLKPEG